MLPIANARLPTAGKGAYLYQRSATHRHRGIDLQAPKGTPVVAPAPGIVEHANRVWRQGFTGYGRNVVLLHADGTRTLHGHLDRVDVEHGELVEEGAQLGTVGTSAFTKAGGYVDERLGPHLHFEVSPRAYPQQSEAPRLDPVAWLRGVDFGTSLDVARPFHRPNPLLGAFALGAFAIVLAKRGRR